MGFSITGPGTPPATPASVTGANNGVGLFGGIVQLGDPYAAVTNISKFLENRALDMDLYFIKWTGQFSGNAFTNIFFNDQDGYLVVENDELNSVIPQTESGFKNRTNPSFAPPFNGSYESIFGQRNTGELFIRSSDFNLPVTGGNVVVFESETILGGVVEMARMQTLAPGLSVLMVNTTTPFGIETIGHNTNSNGIHLVLVNTDPGNSANTMIDFVNDVGQCFVQLNGSGNPGIVSNTFSIDNSSIGGDIFLVSGNGNLRVIANVGVSVNTGVGTGSALDVNGTLNTDAPTGGTTAAGTVQVGQVKPAAVVFDNTRYIEANINGTFVKILVGV